MKVCILPSRGLRPVVALSCYLVLTLAKCFSSEMCSLALFAMHLVDVGTGVESLDHADDLYREVGKCHNAELHTAAPTGVHRQIDGIEALLLVAQSTIAACSQFIHSKTGAHAEFQECKMEKPDVV